MSDGVCDGFGVVPKSPDTDDAATCSFLTTEISIARRSEKNCFRDGHHALVADQQGLGETGKGRVKFNN